MSNNFIIDLLKAILGGQLVITLAVVCILQKLNPYYSLARWLLCSRGITMYLKPSNERLREIYNLNAGQKKIKKNAPISSFVIPQSSDIHLESTELKYSDVIYLRFFTEYKWLLDFSAYSALVYGISEIYFLFFPLQNDVNLSMIWSLIVVFFTMKILVNVTILYFKNKESFGERSLCVSACIFYMLLAMFFITTNGRILEICFSQTCLNGSLNDTIHHIDESIYYDSSYYEIIYKLCISFFCGVMGSFFTFPGLRMAQMHRDSLRICKSKTIFRILLHASFMLPLLLILLWIRPISKENLTIKILKGMDRPFLNQSTFDGIRLVIIIFWLVLRIFLMPTYLQAYLNIASDRVEKLKRGNGRVLNTDLQKEVTSIYSYLCVISLQFIAPLILCLNFTLMYKTSGGFSWIGLLDTSKEDNMYLQDSTSNKTPEYLDTDIFDAGHFMLTTFSYINKVLSAHIRMGLLGFATWWTLFVLFTSSTLGILYQSYMT